MLKDNYVKVRLTSELKEALQEASRLTGLSENDLITLALVSFFSNPEIYPKVEDNKCLH
jgi:hypothetical protein